jgi:hypothetical protein
LIAEGRALSESREMDGRQQQSDEDEFGLHDLFFCGFIKFRGKTAVATESAI